VLLSQPSEVQSITRKIYAKSICSFFWYQMPPIRCCVLKSYRQTCIFLPVNRRLRGRDMMPVVMPVMIKLSITRESSLSWLKLPVETVGRVLSAGREERDATGEVSGLRLADEPLVQRAVLRRGLRLVCQNLVGRFRRRLVCCCGVV
jgi:hypothetical protein